VIKDKQGKVLTDPVEVEARWDEHFSEFYNPVNSNPSSTSIL